MAVAQVNDSNFETEINENEKVVVKYSASWCGSCRLFAPKFKRLAIKPEYSGIKFLSVDTEESPVARRLGDVTNLPAFVLFKNGQFVENFTSNKESEVVEFISKLN